MALYKFSQMIELGVDLKPQQGNSGLRASCPAQLHSEEPPARTGATYILKLRTVVVEEYVVVVIIAIKQHISVVVVLNEEIVVVVARRHLYLQWLILLLTKYGFRIDLLFLS